MVVVLLQVEVFMAPHWGKLHQSANTARGRTCRCRNMNMHFSMDKDDMEMVSVLVILMPMFAGMLATLSTRYLVLVILVGDRK